MQLVTLGKSGSEAASQLQGRIARAFSSKQFGEYHGYEGCYSIYFVSSRIVRLSGLLQKFSNDDNWACCCIFLQKRAGIDKMDYYIFRRKYLLGCLGKLGEVLKQQ